MQTKIEAKLEAMDRKRWRGAYHTKRREKKAALRCSRLRRAIWRAESMRDPRW
jgi:hypothetical protein